MRIAAEQERKSDSLDYVKYKYQDSINKINNHYLENQYQLAKQQFNSSIEENRRHQRESLQQFNYQDSINSLTIQNFQGQLIVQKQQKRVIEEEQEREKAFREDQFKTASTKLKITLDTKKRNLLHLRWNYNVEIHIKNYSDRHIDSITGIIYIIDLKNHKLAITDTVPSMTLLAGVEAWFEIEGISGFFLRRGYIGCVTILDYRDLLTHRNMQRRIFIAVPNIKSFYTPSQNTINEMYDIIKYPLKERIYEVH